MWGREKNFQVSLIYELLNRKNKISLSKVFYCSPFISTKTNNKMIETYQRFLHFPLLSDISSGKCNFNQYLNTCFIAVGESWCQETLWRIRKYLPAATCWGRQEQRSGDRRGNAGWSDLRARFVSSILGLYATIDFVDMAQGLNSLISRGASKFSLSQYSRLPDKNEHY